MSSEMSSISGGNSSWITLYMRKNASWKWANRSQMVIKRKTHDIWIRKKTFNSRHVPSLYLCVETRGIEVLTADSTISAPPFQPLCHQRNVCHPAVNRFTRQTRKRESFIYKYPLHWALLPANKTLNGTLLFVSILFMRGGHFDYWNERLNLRIRVCYLNCHEAGLCCYLEIHIENLLRPLEAFSFHEYLFYRLFLVISCR
jgi:hypothetical protein